VALRLDRLEEGSEAQREELPPELEALWGLLQAMIGAADRAS
jgi:hypothetical protein